MFKEKILIVEDDEILPGFWEEEILAIGDEATEVLKARSYEEAVKLAASRDISYCLLDLGLPKRAGEKPVEVDDPEVCKWGIETLRALARTNPQIEVSIVSRFANHRSVARIKSSLKNEGLPFTRVLDKNLHARDTSQDPHWYLEKIKQDVHGLNEMAGHLAKIGLRVVHPLERRIARRLWRKAGMAYASPLPVIVLRGDTRSGKDHWAEAFSTFIEAQNPNPRRAPMAKLDLGQIGGASSGEAAKISLFGCRNFQDLDDAAGIFERATAYKRTTKGKSSYVHESQNSQQRLARPTDEVDLEACNVAHLVEFGNLPTECQQLLLTVLDSNPSTGGRIIPAGAGNDWLRVGCPVVLSTNARIEERVERSDSLTSNGLREDLYRRLSREPGGWIHLPSLGELGEKAFFSHLRLALQHACGDSVEISPGTIPMLADFYEQGLFDMEAINLMISSVSQSGDRWLMDEHVFQATQGRKEFRRTTGVHVTAAWTLQDFERNGIVQSSGKSHQQYLLLKLGLEHAERQFTPREIFEYYISENMPLEIRKKWLNDQPNSQKTKQRISSAINRLRKKVNEHRESGWEAGNTHLCLRVIPGFEKR